MPEKDINPPALSKLPVFFDLENRSCIVAGAGPGVSPKARLLADAGAVVDIVCPVPDKELIRLFEEKRFQGCLKLRERSWKPDDLTGKTLAIGVFDSEAEAASFADAARDARVPVNLVDRPKLCDFQIPSIVNRSPLIAAISTNGIAPVIGQWLRGRIEALLPSGAERVLAIAGKMRLQVKDQLPASSRRVFWRGVAEQDMAELAGADEDEIEKRLGGRLEELLTGKPVMGRIYLIAAPARTVMMTLSMLRVLQNADIIIRDSQVSRDYPGYARRDAGVIEASDISSVPDHLTGSASNGKNCVWLVPPDRKESSVAALSKAGADFTLLLDRDA